MKTPSREKAYEVVDGIFIAAKRWTIPSVMAEGGVPYRSHHTQNCMYKVCKSQKG